VQSTPHRTAWPQGRDQDKTVKSPADAQLDSAGLFAEFTRDEEAQVTAIGMSALNVLLVGTIGALLLLNSRVLSMVPQMLMTLVHELGHTVAGWLFGYPTIPALDFLYGGGVAIHGDRSTGVVVLLCLIAILALYAVRSRPALLLSGGLTLAAFTIVGVTPWHQCVIAGAGHWAELAFAGIFFYRALANSAIVHQIERPLYACLGAFIVFYNVRFSYRLLTNPYYRQLYDEGKATVHRMDLSRIAEEFLHTDIRTVAAMHLAMCLLPPLCAVAAYATRDRWQPGLRALRDELRVPWLSA